MPSSPLTEKSPADIHIHRAVDDGDFTSATHGHDEPPDNKGNTPHDSSDMHRMGKRQQLRRDFRFVSIVGFVMLLQSTWESVLLAAQYGLVNGGTAGVVWVTVGVVVGAMCMIASMAEMAAMWVAFFPSFCFSVSVSVFFPSFFFVVFLDPPKLPSLVLLLVVVVVVVVVLTEERCEGCFVWEGTMGANLEHFKGSDGRWPVSLGVGIRAQVHAKEPELSRRWVNRGGVESGLKSMAP